MTIDFDASKHKKIVNTVLKGSKCSNLKLYVILFFSFLLNLSSFYISYVNVKATYYLVSIASIIFTTLVTLNLFLVFTANYVAYVITLVAQLYQ